MRKFHVIRGCDDWADEQGSGGRGAGEGGRGRMGAESEEGGAMGKGRR